MSKKSKQMLFNAFTQCSICHHSKGQWKNPIDGSSQGYKEIEYWVNLAKKLEEGCFDALFLADIHGTYNVYKNSREAAIRHSVQFPSNDPTLPISAMAYATKHIGFACTYSTTYFHPYQTAKLFSTLDHLTRGRVAWNIVTSYIADANENFGLGNKLMDHDQRYDRADEYMDVVYQLWEHSWEEDAIVKDIESASENLKNAQSAVDVSRRRLTDIAGRSGAYLEEYKERNNTRQQIQTKLKPIQQEQQELQGKLLQIDERLAELKIDHDRDLLDNQKLNKELESIEIDWQSILKEISIQQKEIDQLVSELSIQQRTRLRLENDQTRIEKDIARLESRRETLQESRGTGALRLLLESGLDGIHGLVANLGEVDNQHKLALEVAAGARISQIVLDNDLIAAKAIELLKKRKAGRLTFLPLNKSFIFLSNSISFEIESKSLNIDLVKSFTFDLKLKISFSKSNSLPSLDII